MKDGKKKGSRLEGMYDSKTTIINMPGEAGRTIGKSISYDVNPDDGIYERESNKIIIMYEILLFTFKPFQMQRFGNNILP